MTDRDPLARLVAVDQIERLKARYFRTLDHKDWAGFADVFTDDAVLELPEVDTTEHGRDAIVASVSAALAGTTTVHHGHTPEIEVTGPDTATGTWAMQDYVEWPPGEDGTRVGLRGYGHYVEEYRREDGRWRISRTRLVRLRVDPLS